MRRFTVEIDEGAFEHLITVANDERRPIREQAAVLLEAALRDPQPTKRAGASLLNERPDGRA